MASNAPLGHVGFLGHPYLFHVALSSSLHPRQDALLLYKIANSSTLYGYKKDFGHNTAGMIVLCS
ncbi:hypothetical protein NC651_004619 [Populus alba x Populus x berolinensis]|nr:hypothetical protein NC651_004619 [Populus alba x Populus x berolinensis]